MKKSNKNLDIYDRIGMRFDNNDNAVGNIFADYTNASQVITSRLKKGKHLDQMQIAKVRA